MKIAIVHDWLTGMRGGEKCLEVFCDLFPQADLFSLLHIPGSISEKIEQHSINTSFLQKFPKIKSHYRYYLPIMPFAVRGWDFKGYDLILSSSHCVAKGIIVPPEIPHLCYCFTPMRYVWDQFENYFSKEKAKTSVRWIMKGLRPWLRQWDVGANKNVSQFVAISKFVQKRIQNFYKRDSTVLYPPVDTSFFCPQGNVKKDFYLMVSAFAPYKRVDLAIKAFNELGIPLIVIGDGQEVESLKKIANSNIKFLGWVSDNELRDYYEQCRAIIFPAEEDFGIVPLEAQAMGSPVICYGKGGVLETVIPDQGSWCKETDIPVEKTSQPTGVYFYSQNEHYLIKAVKHFETIESSFCRQALRKHALLYDKKIFSQKFNELIKERFKEPYAKEI